MIFGKYPLVNPKIAIATWLPCFPPCQDADALDFASDMMRADKEVGFFGFLRIKKGRNKWLGPGRNLKMYFILKLGVFQLVMLIFQGGGFKHWFIFNPNLGEMIQFKEHKFHMGWFNRHLGCYFPGN